MDVPEENKRREIFASLSDYNSKQGISFLIFVVLSLLTVFPIDDYQLFVDAGKITLPFFDAGLPIVPFIIILPLVLLVFHFNILVNLNKHAENFYFLLKNKNKNDEQVLDYSYNPFIFNNIFLADKLVPYSYVSLIIFFSIIYLPAFLMLYIQLRFSEYHSL